MYHNPNNEIYERNEFDMNFDLDLEMDGSDGHKSEIELTCQLVELILIIVMMMWWVLDLLSEAFWTEKSSDVQVLTK